VNEVATITVDAEAVKKRLGSMIGKINHFQRVDLGAALSEFQVDDMGRNRPFTMRFRAKGLAVTKIRPHSKYEMERSARAQKRYVRARKRYEEKWLPSGKKRRRRRPKYVVIAQTYRRWSTRPILRQVMEERLSERLKYTLEQKITWSKTSFDYR